MSDKLSKQDIVAALPTGLRTAVTDNFVTMVNDITQDQLVAERVRENFLTYAGVMREGKFKTEDYLHAIHYTTYKHMGYNNKEAYFKTFPTRQANLVARGVSEKDISAYVAAYHKGRLVQMILEQSLIPMWLLNQDMFQEALNEQAKIMRTAASEKVRSDAADSIMRNLQRPKDAVASLNIDMRENTGLTELKNTLQQLAVASIQAIQQGTPTKDIAGSRLVREDEDITDV